MPHAAIDGSRAALQATLLEQKFAAAELANLAEDKAAADAKAADESKRAAESLRDALAPSHAARAQGITAAAASLSEALEIQMAATEKLAQNPDAGKLYAFRLLCKYKANPLERGCSTVYVLEKEEGWSCRDENAPFPTCCGPSNAVQTGKHFAGAPNKIPVKQYGVEGTIVDPRIFSATF